MEADRPVTDDMVEQIAAGDSAQQCHQHRHDRQGDQRRQFAEEHQQGHRDKDGEKAEELQGCGHASASGRTCKRACRV